MGLLPDMLNCGLRMRRERFPRHRLQSKLLLSDPGMHHDTCATHNFTYLTRDPCSDPLRCSLLLPGHGSNKNITVHHRYFTTICWSFKTGRLHMLQVKLIINYPQFSNKIKMVSQRGPLSVYCMKICSKCTPSTKNLIRHILQFYVIVIINHAKITIQEDATLEYYFHFTILT